jgi:hypothetical protein|tara:strand:+ start:18016 stop:18405 length:390 start_codon:yes stop_codon:yes gene_type:complete
MSIRQHREQFQLAVVQFLADYQYSTGSSLNFAISRFHADSPLVPDHILKQARLGNEAGISHIPSKATLHRWCKQLAPYIKEPQPLITSCPEDLIPLLAEVQTHLRKDMRNPEAYEILTKVSVMREKLLS